MANTFNAESFRNVFAVKLREGWIADQAEAAKDIGHTARVLSGCGCAEVEILNLCLDLETMARGHFEAQYPRYERHGNEIAEIAHEGAPRRFYCYASAWPISPALKSGKSLLVVA